LFNTMPGPSNVGSECDERLGRHNHTYVCAFNWYGDLDQLPCAQCRPRAIFGIALFKSSSCLNACCTDPADVPTQLFEEPVFDHRSAGVRELLDARVPCPKACTLADLIADYRSNNAGWLTRVGIAEAHACVE